MGRKFLDFKNEAKKRKSRAGGNTKPFVVELEDGDTITVNFPDAQTYLALGKVEEGDTLGVLRVMFNNNQKDLNRLIDELKGEDVQVLAVFVEEMWAFWSEDLHKAAGKAS